MIGKKISQYQVLEKLGEGGMGVVYKAHDTKLDRLVALKFLPQRLTSSDTEKARFLQEAKAASAISHPNVCVIHDIHELKEQQFIVMEFIEGITLGEKLQKGPLDKADVIAFAIQIAEALNAAHKKGIIHRDIKSDNIMVTPGNQIKVMDFGLAKLKGSVKLTQSSSTVGTLAYMSPEHIQGKIVDARSDIFSFGVVLYEMLAGKLPFQGEYDSALMYAILNEEPEPIQSHRPDLSSEFLHILNRAMEKDAKDRYQTIDDMLIDLQRLQRDSDRVSRKSLGPMPAESAGRRESKPVYFALGIIGLVVITAVVFLFVKLTGGEGETPFDQMQITRIPTSGKVAHATISPDGRYIVHIKIDRGKESLWLRQIATNSNIEILPSAEVDFVGMTFSPDAEYIYYVQRKKNDFVGELFKVPVLGGSSVRIMEDLHSTIAFSPDGNKIAFIRFKFDEGRTALMVAQVDGTAAEEIAARVFPNGFQSECPAWSPDGKSIICAEYKTTEGNEPVGLIEITIDDKTEKVITDKRWGQISGIEFLSDGSGIVLAAADQSSGYYFQLWLVSYPDGRTRRITNDPNNYVSASLTRDSDVIAAVQSEWKSNIWVYPEDDLSQGKQITSGDIEGLLGVEWTPDGDIVHSSRDFDIWLLRMNERYEQSLIIGEHNAWEPAVSPDGQTVLFASWRDGTALCIWQADMAGGNLKKLTHGEFDNSPRFSSDGRWIIYTTFHLGKLTMWKVPMEGGNPIQLMENFILGRPAVSPDGSRIGCFCMCDSMRPDQFVITVIPFEGGEPQVVSDGSLNITRYSTLRWMPDGQSLAYAIEDEGVWNIWVQPLDGNPPYRLTQFDAQEIHDFEWSRDGHSLAIARGATDNDIVLIRNFR